MVDPTRKPGQRTSDGPAQAKPRPFDATTESKDPQPDRPEPSEGTDVKSDVSIADAADAGAGGPDAADTGEPDEPETPRGGPIGGVMERGRSARRLRKAEKVIEEHGQGLEGIRSRLDEELAQLRTEFDRSIEELGKLHSKTAEEAELKRERSLAALVETQRSELAAVKQGVDR